MKSDEEMAAQAKQYVEDALTHSNGVSGYQSDQGVVYALLAIERQLCRLANQLDGLAHYWTIGG